MNVYTYMIIIIILISIINGFIRNYVINNVKKKYPDYYNDNKTLTWLDMSYSSPGDLFHIYKFMKLIKNDKSLLIVVRIMYMLIIIIYLLLFIFIIVAIIHAKHSQS